MTSRCIQARNSGLPLLQKIRHREAIADTCTTHIVGNRCHQEDHADVQSFSSSDSLIKHTAMMSDATSASTRAPLAILVVRTVFRQKQATSTTPPLSFNHVAITVRTTAWQAQASTAKTRLECAAASRHVQCLSCLRDKLRRINRQRE